MGWLVLIILGCVVGALGVQEVRSREHAFPRPRIGRTTSARRDGWFLVGLGAALVLVALIEMLSLSPWLLLIVVLSAVVGGVAGLVTYEPRAAPGGKVDPPADPDDVWRRNPPGY